MEINMRSCSRVLAVALLLLSGLARPAQAFERAYDFIREEQLG